jgi:hypothetical protein
LIVRMNVRVPVGQSAQALSSHLLRLGFQVPALQVGKDKIEDCNAPLDVFDFVLPAVAGEPGENHQEPSQYTKRPKKSKNAIKNNKTRIDL